MAKYKIGDVVELLHERIKDNPFWYKKTSVITAVLEVDSDGQLYRIKQVNNPTSTGTINECYLSTKDDYLVEL
jgi:uncharacterized membrane protein (UPF0127 family)